MYEKHLRQTDLVTWTFLQPCAWRPIIPVIVKWQSVTTMLSDDLILTALSPPPLFRIVQIDYDIFLLFDICTG